MTIEILNEADGLGVAIDEEHLTRLSRFVMDRMRVHAQAELCIKLVDEETIAELNSHWMGKGGPTDVLSFPMDELRPGLVNEEPEEGVLGDIMIAPTVALRQAEVTGHTAGAEIELLLTHGILHLLGFDHGDAEEKAEMFTLQADLLTEFGSSAIAPSPAWDAPTTH